MEATNDASEKSQLFSAQKGSSSAASSLVYKAPWSPSKGQELVPLADLLHLGGIESSPEL